METINLTLGVLFSIVASWLYLVDKKWEFPAFVALFNSQAYMIYLLRVVQ